MLDFSLGEIALVVVVSVLFIGPKELPVVIRTAGKAMRSVRNLSREVRGVLDDISKESGLHDEIRMIKGDDGEMYETYNHSFSSPQPAPPGEGK